MDQPQRTLESLQGKTVLNSILGGITGFLSAAMVAAVFTPFYVIGILTGGLIAGYAQAGDIRDGVTVGLLSAVMATAPVMLLIVPLSILGIGTVFGWLPWANMGEGPIVSGIVLLGIAFVVMILVFITNVIFGVAGGAIGAVLARESR